jgi:multidrug efflux pump subunit AcrB
MARNHVAANLLMMVFIVGGLVIGTSVKQEVFPEIDLDVITVTVAYPGAGPEEVEEGIILKLEERLNGVNGIKEMRSRAVEGAGTVTLELMDGEDVDEVLQDVKAEVDRLETLPEEAEQPVIAKVVTRSEVIAVAIYGDASERTLRERAEEVQDELLALPGITQVDLVGVRPYEVSIEVPEETLRSHGLTRERIAARVRDASLDLPAGTVKSRSEEVLLRTKEKRYRGDEYADIVVIDDPGGAEVRLGDIAEVRDTFEDADLYSLFDGKPAAMVLVYRVGDQRPDDISALVKEYVEEKGRSLPASLGMKTLNDRSEIFQGRKELLIKNALLGLVLVLVILGLFLRLRLAFWVMLGLPVSFLGAMLFMPMFDVSINMISLFAFILVLGIVVDDAIVVGESIYEHRRRGKPYLQAAVDGALEVGGPVVFSILTTVVAFASLFFITGHMGKFIGVIPVIVISVLAVSLVECLYVLPAHLGRGRPDEKERKGVGRFLRRAQEGFAERLDGFVAGPYTRALGACLRNRPITMAAAVAVLLVSVGLVGGGVIKFRFMPEVEADEVQVSLRMPVGTPAEETERVHDLILREGLEAAAELEREGGPILENVFSLIGGSFGRGPNEGISYGEGNIAFVDMILLPSEERAVSATRVASAWRERVGEIPGAESLAFKSSLMSFGSNIDVRLSHRDFGVLSRAADELKGKLAAYPGVVNMQDDYSQGKSELTLKLKPEARLLGITEADLAVQVRGAFYGVEALRMQRGRNEVKVMVRYPEADRRTLHTLEDMFIRTRDGAREIPLGAAAHVLEGTGYSEINRKDRKRVVSVTADVDPLVANSEEINADLRGTALAELVRGHPGLSFEYGGQEEERAESTRSMLRGFAMALFIIFAMLAVPFKSYSQPLVIMTAIPFGIVGAIGGHLIMGYNLSILSLFGTVALSGVVINDSLLLIDHINRLRCQGVGLVEAVVASGRRRFRPILLTSLTTFFGLVPMILETSLQARFLIPMAISLAFGILFATGITLLLVPTLYTILENAKAHLGFVDKEVCGLMEEE